MRRSGRGIENILVVHRRYEKSRLEEQFVAAAYEIALPQVRRAFDVNLAQASEVAKRLGLAVDCRTRRLA